MALSDNCVIAYHLDETSGTVVDNATGGTDGNNESATINQTGKLNKCYDFNGTKYIHSEYTANADARTVNLWVYHDVAGAAGTFYCLAAKDKASNRSFGFFLLSNGTILYPYLEIAGTAVCTGYDGAAPASSGIATGGWHMMTFTYDEATDDAAIYIDGSSVFTRNLSVDFGAYGTEIWFARREYSGAENNLDGKLDEIGVWSRALSSSEVSQLYNSGTGLAYPFATDVTVSLSTLTLSTTAQEPTVQIDITGGALGLTLAYLEPTPSSPSSDTSGTIKVGTGTIGTRFINKDYPNEEGLIAGTTKQTYHPSNATGYILA